MREYEERLKNREAERKKNFEAARQRAKEEYEAQKLMDA